ncbi:MAG TPA: phosphatidylserine decarboxylase family protein [Thermoanaerobaculia bacterium]|nr:phosphatidylserine decarboxylase family protein [Thermoanaerobaculia bacterium]
MSETGGTRPPHAGNERRRWRLAPEGWIFVVPVAILGAVALLIQWYVAAMVFSFIVAFLLHFFRDPERSGSERHIDVLSPADGTVVQIRDVADGDVWPGLTRQVSIFMSVFDVHVNRAPISGRIVHYRYSAGKRMVAMSHKSSLDNEQNLIVMTDNRGATLAFKQIAGLLARRIVFDKKEGDEVARGERIGMIKFGSRVDVFFPANAHILVKPGDKPKAGLTILAEIPE